MGATVEAVFHDVDAGGVVDDFGVADFAAGGAEGAGEVEVDVGSVHGLYFIMWREEMIGDLAHAHFFADSQF